MATSYNALINLRLPKPKLRRGPKVLDLFSGCGGLSLGFEAAGFRVTGYEMNQNACETHRSNLSGDCKCEILTVDSTFPEADVIVGGPPCQPFSVVGTQAGAADHRNGLEVFVSAVQQVRPDFWMFENVRGLLGRSQAYLQDVLRRLSIIGYTVEPPRILNAREFGVPQNRERVVVVGYRRGKFEWPSRDISEISVRTAIGRTALQARQNSRFLTPAMDAYIAKYEKASCCKTPRDLSLDKVARTLTCRNLGGATGDMIRLLLPDGRRRLLSVSEAARLQSFPSWFRFTGSYTSKMTQIGNAVPPMLALALANSIKAFLAKQKGG